MRQTYSLKERLLALTLCAVMVLGMVPAGNVAAAAAEYGSVTALTVGDVSGSETAESTVNVSDVTLEWAAADAAVGRDQDGWWVGAKITAPDGMTKESDFIVGANQVMYQSMTGADSWSEAKSFWNAQNSSKTDEDTERYLTVWGRVNEEYLESFLSQHRKLNYGWRFDWNMDGEYEQTVKMTVDPKNVVLMKDGVQAYPDPMAFVFEDRYPEVITYGDEFANPIVWKAGYGKITYSVDAPTVAAVDANGTLTVKNIGTVTVTAKMEENAVWGAQEASYVLTVQPKPFELYITNETKSYREPDPDFSYTTNLENESDVIWGFSPFRISGETVGTYSVSARVTVNPKYAMTMASGTLTIVKAKQPEFGFAEKSKILAYEKDMIYTQTASGGNGTGEISYAVVSGADVAEVDEKTGILTIKKPGTVTVTATKEADDCYDQAEDSYVLTVTLGDISNQIAFEDGAPEDIYYGDSFANVIDVKPGYGKITYSVDNEKIATVDENGVLTIKKAGTVTVTAKMEESEYYSATQASYVLTIQPKPFTLTINSCTKAYGETDPKFTYTTDLENEQDVIQAFSPFRAVGEAVGDYAISARVTVNPNYTMKMVAGMLTIVKAEQTDFAFQYPTPDERIYEKNMTFTNVASGGKGSGNVTYSVNDESVASVNNNGVLSIHKAGTVTVTATKAEDACYKQAVASYVLTVKTADAQTEFSFEKPNPESIYYGDTFSNAIIHKEGYSKITYSVDNDKVATVDENGVLTIKKVGTVTVIAKMEKGDYYSAAEASYTLTINQKPFTLTVNDERKTYGEEDPAFSYTTDIELPEGIITLHRYLRTDTSEKAGEYKVTAEVTVNPNYKVTVVAGTLTIHRAEQTGFAFKKDEPADLIYRKGLTFTNVASGGQSSSKITYSVSDEKVASVDENGMLTIHKAGTVTVTAVKAQDDYYQKAEDSYTLTIQTADAQTEFGFEQPVPDSIYYGDSFSNAIVHKEGYSKITYSVDNDKVATVDENGVLTIKKVGTVTVTAKMEKGDYYGAAEASYTLTIDQKPFILTVNDKSKTYGEADPDFGYTTDIELPEGAITLHYYYRHDKSEKAGSYKVTAVVTVNPNYKVTVVAGTLTIKRADQTGLGFAFEMPNPGTVTFAPNKTFTNKASGGPGTGEVTYAVTEGEDVAAVDEKTGILTINQAGTVTVTATRAQDDYYNSTTATYTLTVKTADQTGFAFGPASETVTFDKNATEKIIEAKGGQSGKDITYKVVEGADVAQVGEKDGKLVIKKAGTVKVEATRAGDERYNSVTATYTLTVEKATQEFSFELGDSVELIYGVKESSNGVIYANYNHNDLALTYAVPENTIGASVAEDGLVSFGSSEGQVGSVTVTVTKPGDERYLPYEKTYTLNLSYLTLPEGVECSLSGTKLNESGWYSASPVVIHAPNGYQISYSNDLENAIWTDSVEHTIEGVNTAEVFLKEDKEDKEDKEEGGITSVIRIEDIKLDTAIPQTPVITYGVPVAQKLLEELTFGFYKASVQVVVTAEDLYDGTKDAASGIETITLIFEGQKGKYITEEVSITEIQNGEELIYTMDKEFYGTVSAYAVDIAGHQSLTCNVGVSGEDGIQTVVVDSVAPEVNVAFQTADADTTVKQVVNDPAQGKPSREDVAPADANTRYVYSGTLQAVITVKEANFYEDNITVTVLRDGVAYTRFTPADWVAAEEAAVFQKTITLTEDGDYQLLMEYADNSGNDMELTSGEYGQEVVKTYTSNIHTVDASGGTFQVEYKTEDAANGNHYSTERNAVITVTDRNFRPDGVVFQVTSGELASDETVSDTALNTWDAWTAVEGKEHTWQASYALPGDHRYEITMSAKDIAGNALLCDNAETYTNGLVVDGSSPENLTVEYSKHTLDQILENLTFGYHKADKVVTLTATDTVSGIKSFQVQVTPDGSEQATNIAIPENLVITVDNGNVAVLSGEPGFVENVSAETEDGTTSVSFKVPAEFRGTIDFAADNMAAVSSEKADNRQVLIVDNMAPRRSMTFTPNRVVDALTLKDMAEDYIVTEGDEIIMYYTDDAVATIRVQEENFYPDEVQISVTRDGAVYTGFTVSEWTQVAEEGVLDTYEKTITIPQTDEGDYFITMTYTDKSGNVMEAYTSQCVVIDNTAPTIEYAYSNNSVISTSDDGSRNYFNAVQTVKVTINDRNFRADDVVIKVNAKDVAGGDVLPMNDEKTFVKAYAEQGAARDQWTSYVEGTWRAEGDSYEIVLAFDADANYDLSVEYTDLATNSFASETKSFTVDKTAPEITNVEYSEPNIVDEVLKAITFDNYYGGKVTVTVTIKEDTSGIDEIIYSYLKRAGSSNVNAGESDIMITEGIERKDNMFTVKFQVPRVDLTNTTQFDGTVTVTANDRSNNTTQHEGDQRLVVDNISPRSTVIYNAPVTTVNGISYYAGDIEVAVEINEANFDSGDVKVTARKDGEDYPVKVNWTNNSVDRHTGTFVLTEDGDYTISVTYKDKSGNQMQNYTSDQLTLDTTLPVIGVSNVKVNSANKDEVYGFVITVKDTNLDASSLAPSLTAVVKGEDGTYTTQTIALGEAQVVTEGQEYTYTVENLTEDALYTLTCSAKDMSANTTSSILLDDGKSYETVQFSINRNGSTFGYGSDYTDSVVSQYYVYSVDEDVVLVEVNADPIENYTVKLNGTELTEGTDYTTEQTSNDGEWSKRTYKLSKDLFAQEGAYNIIVSSVDKAETTAYSDVKNVRTAFVVDQTAPVITITGLEDGGRYQTDEQTVTLIPSDEGGRLNSLKVVALDSDGNPLVNEETGEDISVRFDMSGEELLEYLDANDGKVTITVPGGLNNQVRIVCDDCAANSEGKPNTYEKTFERVTVSQSGLVIFYANKPAFYGTIGGTAGAAGLLVFLLTKKKKNAKA